MKCIGPRRAIVCAASSAETIENAEAIAIMSGSAETWKFDRNSVSRAARDATW